MRAYLFGFVAPLCVAQITFGGGDSITRTEYVHRPLHGTAQRGGGGGPFGGVVPGVAIVAASTALLWWNEGRTARSEHMLDKAWRKVVRVDGSQPLDPVNDGELIHIYSPSVNSPGIMDEVFHAVHRPGAARLKRRTEAYLWQETAHTTETRVSSDTVKRQTTYSYSTHWRDHTVSSHFHDGGRHRNPSPRIPPGTSIMNAQDVTLGNGIPLDDALVDQLGEWRAVHLTADGGPPTGLVHESGSVDGTPLSYIEGAVVAPVGDGSECIYLPLSGDLPPGMYGSDDPIFVPQHTSAPYQIDTFKHKHVRCRIQACKTA